MVLGTRGRCKDDPHSFTARTKKWGFIEVAFLQVRFTYDSGFYTLRSIVPGRRPVRPFNVKNVACLPQIKNPPFPGSVNINPGNLHVLHYQHGISITEETIFIFNGFFVGFHHHIITGESTGHN